MLKVLQLIPTLDRSGAEKQMVLLAKGLRAIGSTLRSLRSRGWVRWKPSSPPREFR